MQLYPITFAKDLIAELTDPAQEEEPVQEEVVHLNLSRQLRKRSLPQRSKQHRRKDRRSQSRQHL